MFFICEKTLLASIFIEFLRIVFFHKDRPIIFCAKEQPALLKMRVYLEIIIKFLSVLFGNVLYNSAYYLLDINKVQCEICFKFIHKNTIYRHKKNQHGDALPAQCNQCERIFKNETTLKNHLRQTHNIYQSQDALTF